jgi:hypothetical protein
MISEVKLCEYCGDPSDTVDHTPAISHRHQIIMAGLKKRIPFISVPACRSCNSTIGNRPLWSTEERRDYVKKRLRRRYASLLRMPRWNRDDLEELDGRLREYVKNSNTELGVLKARLDWGGNSAR